MSVMAHEPLSQEDILLEGFLALDTPKGFRAELIEGDIVVTPPPDGDHEECIGDVQGQISRGSETPMRCYGNKGLKISRPDLQHGDRVIPDMTVAPEELRLFRGADPWVSSAGVALVVEVTSSRPGRDRELKRRSYACGQIPLYLLLDRDHGTVTLFSEPDARDYVQALRFPFGKPVPLPEPFGFDLDTSEFG
ncbi:hypothetical protein N566_14420 [Streptomycetaceae bacterium MP113-05]|nr:hypothetical protein N566_14420 [Streptomycetaceae bacterium MP113-05]